MGDGLVGIGLIGALVGLVLAVLWFFLPFAVFGMKGRVDEAIEQARIANGKLDLLIAEMQRANAAANRSPPTGINALK